MKNNKNLVLSIRGLSKSFPGVQALKAVDFTLLKGEIHGLVGENGAGKSTLIKCLTGVYRRDAGEIIYNGQPIDCSSPLHAQEIGISSVYQEVNLVPNLSVAENIFLGHYPIKSGRIDWKGINRQAKEILKWFDIIIDVEKNLGEYSIAIQQMIAIARALELQSKIFIFDEPTSSLNVQETEQLFTQMRRLKAEGNSIIFITHLLDQVYKVCDTITVLRNGRYIGTYLPAKLPKAQLISKLLGREIEKLDELNAKRPRTDGTAIKEKEGEVILNAKGVASQNGIQPFDITIKKGDVFGCAGLLGSGKTEVANIFFGIDTADAGSLEINGKAVEIKSPGNALKQGIALSPEDRKTQGIIEGLSVRENIILALQNRKGWKKTLSLREQTEIAEKFIKMLNIKTPSAEQAIENLSGGNQQKVIIARWLATNPQLLILDEPTRGIDVGAKVEIQKLIIELSQQGMAVMFISSEINEIARCSTKVMIMQDMNVSDILYREDVNEDTIMHSIVEGHVSNGK